MKLSADHHGQHGHGDPEALGREHARGRVHEAGDVGVGVADDGHRLDRRDGDVGEDEDPAPDAADQHAVAEAAHMDEGTAAREHGGELGIDEGQEQHRHAADHPGPDAERPRLLGRMQRPEQPARPDHAADAGVEQPDDPGLASELAARSGRAYPQSLRNIRSDAHGNLPRRHERTGQNPRPAMASLHMATDASFLCRPGAVEPTRPVSQVPGHICVARERAPVDHMREGRGERDHLVMICRLCLRDLEAGPAGTGR